MQAARREERGSALVAEAIEGGDQRIERLASEGLGQAHAEMLRRDREEERRRAAALRRQRQHEHERGEQVLSCQAADPEPDGAAALAGGPGPR